MEQLRQEYIRVLSAYLASPDEAHLFEAQTFGMLCAEKGVPLSGLLNTHFNVIEAGEVTLGDENLLSAQKFLLQTALAISIRSGAETTIENVLAALYDETVIRFEKELYELNASNERFRTLVQTIPDIVYLIDKDGTFHYLNDTIRSLGYEPHELLGRHFSSIILPSDVSAVSRNVVLENMSGRATGDSCAPKLFDERRTGSRKTIGLEVRLMSRNRELRPGYLETFGGPEIVAEINSSGLFVTHAAAGGEAASQSKEAPKVFFGTVGVIRDITARKQMEVELRAHRDHLETLIGERTSELISANEELHREIIVRTEIEEALKASEEQYRGVVDNIAVGVSLIDPDMKILALNSQMKRWFPHIDVSVRPLCYRSFNVPPREDICSYCPTRKTLSDGQVHEAVTETPACDGIVNYRIVSSAIKDKEGRVTAAIEIVEDITDRKKAEDAQRKAEESLQKSEAFTKDILQSVGEGLIVIDHDFTIISANRAYCEQVKLACEEVVGRHCYEVSHHRDRPCSREGEDCAPTHTFRTGTPHIAIHTHYDKDNNPIYIETKSFPMQDASGKVYAVIETLNNITEKRKLEDQLRHAQKMEAIGTLAGGIAHDFNNLLNVIIGYAGLMQMRMTQDDPLLTQLKEILGAGDRAAHLAKGLLTFSRKQVLEMKIVNLKEIVEGFKKMLARIIGEDIDLKITHSEKDLSVKADIVQIEQVLMNLAANARDAMPQGGALTIETSSVRIDAEFIRAHCYGEPGPYALITVSDTGIGMDEKTRERIFEPYFTTKEMGRGTGLGLAIVYGIVTQHDGYIRCYSEPGKGTTFRIYMPLVKAAADTIEKEETVAPKGGTETILIAEDDVYVRTFMKDVLEGYGYKIIEAVDGEDAVRKYGDHKDDIQLFLSDLIMPKKNGKDAYEDIRGIRYDIRAIFISGYARDIIQRFGIEEGVEFISKPVLPNELLRKVREELDK